MNFKEIGEVQFGEVKEVIIIVYWGERGKVSFVL